MNNEPLSLRSEIKRKSKRKSYLKIHHNTVRYISPFYKYCTITLVSLATLAFSIHLLFRSTSKSAHRHNYFTQYASFLTKNLAVWEKCCNFAADFTLGLSGFDSR